MVLPLHHGATRYRAFSLVEISIALGLISFCLVTVVGLLPVGLTTMRRAMDASIERQIVQQLSGEAQQLPFSQVRAAAGNDVRYFDERGMPVSSSAEARYRSSIFPAVTAFPGSTNETLTDTMQMLQIRIVTEPAGGTNFYNFMVVNSGQD